MSHAARLELTYPQLVLPCPQENARMPTAPLLAHYVTSDVKFAYNPGLTMYAPIGAPANEVSLSIYNFIKLYALKIRDDLLKLGRWDRASDRCRAVACALAMWVVVCLSSRVPPQSEPG